MTTRFLVTTALSSLTLSFAGLANAQTTITTAETTAVNTSTAGTGGTPDDVILDTTGSVTLTTAGPAVIVDSSNDLTLNGNVTIEDVDNATGVELQGGNTSDVNLNGAITITEDYTTTDTDGDLVPDGTFATGTGRTGVLISGASPFVGNVAMDNTASITVEGNDSYGIQLAPTASLTGDLLTDGTLRITGDNSIGMGIEGQIVGNLANSANIASNGTNAQSINVQNDITGSFLNEGTITNTGYRFVTRPNAAGRDLLGAEDLEQAGAAVQISGNVTSGVLMDQLISSTTDADGTTTTTISRSNVTQFGNAPAILIDGQGTPIMIGRVSAITLATDPDFDANLLYAFVNEGDLTANGIYDDVNSTTFEVRDATLDDGINNTGTMQAVSYRSGNDGTADVAGFTGAASVIVIGNNAIAERINNAGLISASVLEATDEIYADTSNVINPRVITATAIDVQTGGSLDTITNSGSIRSIVSGRNGVVTAIRDTTGTVFAVNNTGEILAQGVTSDALGNEATNFTTIALDLAANTSGVTVTQSASTTTTPSITGDILLGSGDDTVDVSAGTVIGDLSFGNGADALTLSGGSGYLGDLTDTDGDLVISVAGSTLANTSSASLNVTSATFDGTSTYRPTLDGATGDASTLVASSGVTFDDGATIAPFLANIIGNTTNTFTIADATALTIGAASPTDLAGSISPFMYDTTYSIDPMDANALIVTLDLKDTTALGLDNAQTSLFTSAFEALGTNSGLGNAFINITNADDFNSAYNQLMPEFSAVTRQFITANVDGGTGAVSSHLDNVRRSQDRSGGAWIQEYAYFADRSLAGLSEQYRGSGFGFNAGLDTAMGPFHAVGFSLGFASTEVESVLDLDDPLDVLTVQFGSYAGLQSGNLGLEAQAGFGYNDIKSERNIAVGSYTGSSKGDWGGMHYNASLRAGYDVAFSDKYFMRPAVSVDYLQLREKAYTERGDSGIALEIDKRNSTSASATAMVNFGAQFMGKRTWVRPMLRAGYRNDFVNDSIITTGRFVGLTTPFEIESEAFPDSGFLLGFSVAAGSEYSSFSFDFDSDIRDGFIRHTGRVVLRLLF